MAGALDHIAGHSIARCTLSRSNPRQSFEQARAVLFGKVQISSVVTWDAPPA
jgi:hypothetical protein